MDYLPRAINRRLRRDGQDWLDNSYALYADADADLNHADDVHARAYRVADFLNAISRAE